MIFHRSILIAAAAMMTASCASAPKTPNEMSPARDSFWSSVSALCGQTLHGKMVSNEAVDADMAGRPMRMTVASCADSEIRIPFHVGPLKEGGKWDTSRTWVLRKTAKGIQLKHDHRHEDGTPDAVTNYGGEWDGKSFGTRFDGLMTIAFPVDDESIANFRQNGLDKSVTNIWSVSVRAADIMPRNQNGAVMTPVANSPKFSYELNRTGENARHFKVEFY